MIVLNPTPILNSSSFYVQSLELLELAAVRPKKQRANLNFVCTEAFKSLELQTMVVSALVNLADWNNDHRGELGIRKNGLANSTGFLADFMLVDILFTDLAGANEATR